MDKIWRACSNHDKAESFRKMGDANRSIRATGMNPESSRGHTLFILRFRKEVTLEVKDLQTYSFGTACICMFVPFDTHCHCCHNTCTQCSHLTKTLFGLSGREVAKRDVLARNLGPLHHVPKKTCMSRL